MAAEHCIVLIGAHRRRLTGFSGYQESEIAATEARLGVSFPAVFREYLLQIGRSRGQLFQGSDLATPDQFEQFRADAEALLRESHPSLSLPREAVVFLSHQGYMFLYVLAACGFDGPPMSWTETEGEPVQVAATFAEMVDAELRQMEELDRKQREDGGTWLKLHPGGGATETYPARASGERPLYSLQSRGWWQSFLRWTRGRFRVPRS